jgi:arylsulfatase A-like enzyme
VAAGRQCDQLVHQADLLATCAAILDVQLPAEAGEDSVSLLSILSGQHKPIREHAVSQSIQGVLAIRQGPWKLIFGSGSGGWTKGSVNTPGQLYNLADVLGEEKNLYAREPERVAELTARMEQIIANGRSTPGPPQQNDAAIGIRWKK